MIINKFTATKEVRLRDIREGTVFSDSEDIEKSSLFIKTCMRNNRETLNYNICIDLEDGEYKEFLGGDIVYPVHAELNVSPLGVGDC